MGTPLTRYVSLLMFSADGQRVAVLTKNRPAFLAGRLCPVGGHIEAGEPPVAAAVREFLEETGVNTGASTWKPFALCEGSGWEMHCFTAFDDSVANCRSTTEEPVVVMATAELLGAAAVDVALAAPDLIALIGLALQTRHRDTIVQMVYG